MKKQNINEVFRKWGKEKQELPKDNVSLKEEILAKVPFSVDGYRNLNKKKKSLPWFPMAFATMAILVLIGNTGFQRKNYENNAVMPFNLSSVEMKQTRETSGSYKDNLKMKSEDFVHSVQNVITDTREFLKTNYRATIKTRKIVDMADKIGVMVRGFGGRINSISSGGKTGHISFSIPADQFEMFRSEIKRLTNARLFVEEKSSTNMLPQKQVLEKKYEQVGNSITDSKNEKAQLTKNHSQVVDSYNSRIKGLDEEVRLLQIEWSNVDYNRTLEINSRLTQIQEEENALQTSLATENKNYNNKLNSINQKLKALGNDLENVEQQDENLVDDVSMVDGTIYLEWISLWKLVDMFTPGPLLAWILVIIAGVSYWRDRRSMRVFE